MRFDKTRFHLNHRYMLFGPPGIGKSTTIRWLQKLGFKAIDLEEVDPCEWDNVIATTDAQFIAAAGVHPTHPLPSGILRVLLWTKQSRYDIRRANRDLRIPSKANQRKHTIQEWRQFNWDLEVNNASGDYDTWEARTFNFLYSLQSAEDKL